VDLVQVPVVILDDLGHAPAALREWEDVTDAHWSTKDEVWGDESPVDDEAIIELAWRYVDGHVASLATAGRLSLPLGLILRASSGLQPVCGVSGGRMASGIVTVRMTAPSIRFRPPPWELGGG
jgi:hypothetical protein